MIPSQRCFALNLPIFVLPLILFLAMLLPQPAAAQLFPCNGDGPGQRMMGMDNSTTPPTPVCQAVEGGAGPATGSLGDPVWQSCLAPGCR